MFSSIAQDQIIAQDQARERTTTDDSLLFVGTATGQVDSEAKQTTPGWRKLMSTAMVATWLGAPSTPALAGEHAHVVLVAEQAGEGRSSVAQALSQIADRYESILFSYPARVLEIERNVSGDPVIATLLVSVDGNDNVIKRPVRQFGFDVKPDMRLIVDGVHDCSSIRCRKL